MMCNDICVLGICVIGIINNVNVLFEYIYWVINFYFI